MTPWRRIVSAKPHLPGAVPLESMGSQLDPVSILFRLGLDHTDWYSLGSLNSRFLPANES
jgi:hypothetical protein